MKIITAIIQPDKLDEVREALIDAGIGRITVSRVTGHGNQSDFDLYRGQKITPVLIPKINIKIACNDKYVDIAVNAILTSARHGDGKIGDGKIFITELQECYRIRTGEKGSGAI